MRRRKKTNGSKCDRLQARILFVVDRHRVWTYLTLLSLTLNLFPLHSRGEPEADHTPFKERFERALSDAKKRQGEARPNADRKASASVACLPFVPGARLGVLSDYKGNEFSPSDEKKNRPTLVVFNRGAKAAKKRTEEFMKGFMFSYAGSKVTGSLMGRNGVEPLKVLGGKIKDGSLKLTFLNDIEQEMDQAIAEVMKPENKNMARAQAISEAQDWALRNMTKPKRYAKIQKKRAKGKATPLGDRIEYEAAAGVNRQFDTVYPAIAKPEIEKATIHGVSPELQSRLPKGKLEDADALKGVDRLTDELLAQFGPAFENPNEQIKVGFITRVSAFSDVPGLIGRAASLVARETSSGVSITPGSWRKARLAAKGSETIGQITSGLASHAEFMDKVNDTSDKALLFKDPNTEFGVAIVAPTGEVLFRQEGKEVSPFAVAAMYQNLSKMLKNDPLTQKPKTLMNPDDPTCSGKMADDDEDGVPNSKDRCPNTEKGKTAHPAGFTAKVDTGETYDFGGCAGGQFSGFKVPSESIKKDTGKPPVSGSPPNKANENETMAPSAAQPAAQSALPDDDGDGVPNAQDRCPNTEKGKTVYPAGFTAKVDTEETYDFGGCAAGQFSGHKVSTN